MLNVFVNRDCTLLVVSADILPSAFVIALQGMIGSTRSMVDSK